MSLEENKAVVLNWLDARNANDVEKALSFISPELHDMVRIAFNGFTTSFLDLSITINQMIAESDKVVCWWKLHGTHLGVYENIPATGKKIEMIAIDIYTITDGKISWLERGSDLACDATDWCYGL
jgi:steroid delta-isomerase-like uncharacterized protein